MRYDYKCETCGNVFEETRRMADSDEPAWCPDCEGFAKKQFSIGVKINTGDHGRMGTMCHSLPGESVLVRNKNHFKELCKQHGLTPTNL